MANSAKRRKPQHAETGIVQRGLASAGAFVSDNPALVGGSTSFLVALLYVSANALWYQPHAHTGPLFATRAFETFVDPQRAVEEAQPQTTFRIERPEPEARRPLADPVVEKVQSVLKDLNFYAGDVDGLKGPGTERAVRAYQDKMGLEATGRIDQQLLEALGQDETTGAIAPPVPGPPPLAAADGDVLIKDIQLGLRAFGNADITVDGIAGARTRSAIMEFQSLFGLPEDGEPTKAVRDKMREARLLQ